MSAYHLTLVLGAWLAVEAQFLCNDIVTAVAGVVYDVVAPSTMAALSSNAQNAIVWEQRGL